MHLLVAGLSLGFLMIAARAQALGQPQASPGGVDAGDASGAIESVSLVLHDDARGKDLAVRVVYPETFRDQGPAPTIIFSHGAGGSGTMYGPLAHHWASAGYIVILPTHSDSLLGRQIPGQAGEGDGEQTVGQRVRERIRQRRGNAGGGREGLGGIDLSDWPNRPRDVSFVIDSLDVIERSVPALVARIDRDRVGVGGHSFGAFTAQLIGGVDPLGPAVFADPRARCVLLISPQGVGGLLTEQSWSAFPGPALTITGDNDTGHNGEPAIWRRDGFDLSPADTHTLLWVTGAYHNFGGISGRVLPLPDQGPENPAHVALVQRATLAFWDHHLRDASGNTDAFADELRQRLKGEDVQIENN